MVYRAPISGAFATKCELPVGRFTIVLPTAVRTTRNELAPWGTSIRRNRRAIQCVPAAPRRRSAESLRSCRIPNTTS